MWNGYGTLDVQKCVCVGGGGKRWGGQVGSIKFIGGGISSNSVSPAGNILSLPLTQLGQGNP